MLNFSKCNRFFFFSWTYNAGEYNENEVIYKLKETGEFYEKTME